MTRFLLDTILRNILMVVCCTLVCLWTPAAFAQHGGGGGHVGGGGAHMSPPPSFHAPSSVPHAAPAPHPGPVGTSALRFPPRHPPVPAPVYPVYGYYPFFFGSPFYYGLGFGWGFDSCWLWSNCDLFWGFGGGAYDWAPYGGYGYSGAYGYSAGSYTAPSAPSYPVYGGGQDDTPQLYFKDGTVYSVTDYWIVDDQLHFTMRDDGKIVERDIPFDALDLQRTIDVAKQRGFQFVLRDEPVGPYLQHHPEPAPEKQ
jgi:hypothetical protein